MSRRYFSATAFFKKVLNWKLNGTTTEIGWAKTSVESEVDRVPALAKNAAKATIDGNPHETRKKDGSIDPYHASGTILSGSNRRLTSFHVYENGFVRFSKDQYNVGSSEAGSSTQASSGFRTDMSWRMNSDKSCALWWDGAAWQEGQWSEQHGKWVASHNGQWYAWE